MEGFSSVHDHNYGQISRIYRQFSAISIKATKPQLRQDLATTEEQNNPKTEEENAINIHLPSQRRSFPIRLTFFSGSRIQTALLSRPSVHCSNGKRVWFPRKRKKKKRKKARRRQRRHTTRVSRFSQSRKLQQFIFHSVCLFDSET